MPVADITDLTPEAAEVVERYLADLSAAMCSVDPQTAEDVLAEIRTHLLDALETTSSAQDARSVAAEFGEPDAYGATLCALLAEDEPNAVATPDTTVAAGDVLGMPYDVRMPTASRVGRNMWDPHNPRLFVPRSFGIGWDLNFGAVAVKLNLIEPDAEDEPFGEVPDRVFIAMAAIPVAFTAYIVISFLLVRDALPADLPVHWDVSGNADRFWPATAAFLLPFAMAVVPTAWALKQVFTGAARFERGITIALATLLSSVAAGIWWITLQGRSGEQISPLAVPALVLAAIALPLIMLVTLARIGRSAEVARDLSGQGRKGGQR